jgi:hypothetical protein
MQRAHRIGQTRPIVVKTLAIRNTVEEEIMKRRVPNSKSKDVCVDDGMRGFLKVRLPSFSITAWVSTAALAPESEIYS